MEEQENTITFFDKTADEIPFEVENPRKVKPKPSIPRNESDTLAVVKRVAEKYATVNYQLQWMPPAKLRLLGNQYEKAKQQKDQSSAKRTPESKRIRAIHKDANTNIEHVKSYLQELNSSATGVISNVSSKNTYKNEIAKVFRALMHLIKAQHPDNWEAELRIWGFDKNRY